MKQTLTEREADVLRYIYGFEVDNGYVPSLSAIAEKFGWLSKDLPNRSAAKVVVDKLAAKGYLKKKPVTTIGYELL